MGSSGANQAGNAAVASPLYNIKSTGAVKANGIADDTAALIASIAASPAGSTIVFPPGTYLVSQPIPALAGGRRYLGLGHAKGYGARIVQKAGTNMTGPAGGPTALFVPPAWLNNSTTCDGQVVFENLYFSPARDTNPSSTASGIILCNFWSQVLGCMIDGTAGPGILLTDVTANGTNVITNSASECDIIDCKINDCVGAGIRQVSANHNSNQDGNCLNNRISAVAGHGLEFQRGAGWTFDNNHFYGVTGDGINADSCYATRITKNYIENYGEAASPGTYYAGIAINQLNGRGTVISGNMVGCSEVGGSSFYQYIRAKAGSGQTNAHAVVANNTLEGPGVGTGYGVVVESASGGVMHAAVGVNDIAGINTPYDVSGSNIVSSRIPGDLYVDGAVHVGGSTAATEAQLAGKAGKTDIVFNVIDSGADNTGATFCDTAIENAKTLAGATGTVYFPAGTYKIASTKVFTCNVDASPDAILSYTGSGLAVQLNNDVAGVRLQRKNFTLPQISCATKPSTGWVSGTVGLKTINLQRCIVGFARIAGFETGMLLYGNGEGSAYLEVHAGHFDNNKINTMFDGTGGGYANQNTFIGGSWSHNSGEGTNVAGTKHIYMADITGAGDPNNNVFLNASLESPTVVEYVLDIQAGSCNIWVAPRFEYTSGNAAVRWGAGATRNLIIGGIQVDTIVETHTAGSTFNNKIGTGSYRFSTLPADGMVVENSGSSSNAAMTIMRAGGIVAGDSTTTAYAGRLQASAWKGKRSTDTADRVIIDITNGKIQLGNGAAAPVSQWSEGAGSPEGVVTAGVGSIYSRNNGGTNTAVYYKESGTGNTGWVPIISGAATAVINRFTTTGTFTKPAGAKTVLVTLIAGGSGGGSGRRGAASTARAGGAGGAGGAVTQMMLDASLVPSSLTVTVGTGGAGAAAATADDTSGSAGTAGNSTLFGSFFRAFSGAAGAGGTAAIAAGGAGSIGTMVGGTGGASNITTGLGGTGGGAAGAPGGGAGGSITAANAAGAGGAGQTSWGNPAGGTGGTGGTVDTTAPTTGGSVTTNVPAPGGGGGGGAASITTAAQAGATGGAYGGGGGGGGASLNGNNSGAGGNGADGYAEIVTYF